MTTALRNPHYLPETAVKARPLLLCEGIFALDAGGKLSLLGRNRGLFRWMNSPAESLALDLCMTYGEPLSCGSSIEPQNCIQVTLLNFTITQEGLSDQLLSVAVAEEKPDLEAQRQHLVVESAANKAKLASIETRILQVCMNI